MGSSKAYQAAPTYEEGFGNGPNNTPYDQGPTHLENHEMQSFHPDDAMSQADFLSRVSAIRDDISALTSSVRDIAQLHQRALASGSSSSPDNQLDWTVSRTRDLVNRIRDQLYVLRNDVERTPTAAGRPLKTRQFDALNADFRRELQAYMQEEQQYRERYRDQIARQYRIVNPDATDEEVRMAKEQDWGNEGVFQTALRSNRSGQASAVLGAVRARHNELQRIEHSITELASLFRDLETLVVQQDAVVARAEEQTEQANLHLDKGNDQVKVATDHARRRRKLKWWCLLVVLLILIAIAVGVGVGVKVSQDAAKTATNAAGTTPN